MHARFLLLVLFGLVTGVLTVLTGGGGGLVYTAVLTACFGIPGPTAASCSLATMFPTLLFGSHNHWKRGHVRIEIGTSMTLAGACGCLAGSLWSVHVPRTIYQGLLSAILLVSGLTVFVKRNPTGENQAGTRKARARAIALGSLGGLLAGMFGMSGSAPIIAALASFGLNAVEVIGTSVVVLAGISFAGLLAHSRIGTTDWTLTALLLAGTIPGAWIAPLLLNRIGREAIERYFLPVIATVLIIMAVYLLWSAVH